MRDVVRHKNQIAERVAAALLRLGPLMQVRNLVADPVRVMSVRASHNDRILTEPHEPSHVGSSSSLSR